jgi:Na+-driven multidrug efflux pump
MGVVVQLYALARKSDRVRILARHLRVIPSVMWQLVRLSGTGMFQVLVGTASWIGLVRVLSTFGSDALAGYTISIRVILFTLLPAWGLSNAAATMVGQALGAKKPDRAEAAVWMAGRFNLVFLGSVGVLYFIFAPAIIGAFSHSPLVDQYGIEAIRIIALGFPMYAWGMVLTQSFNGAGRHLDPDAHQHRLLLVLGNPAGACALDPLRVRAERSVHRDRGRFLNSRHRKRCAVSTREVEDA